MKAGNKVVCIDDTIKVPIEIHNKHFSKWIKKDEIYTIRAITETPMGYGVLLKEIKNPSVYIEAYFGKAEPRFSADRFRLLDDVLDTVDISEAIEETEELVI